MPCRKVCAAFFATLAKRVVCYNIGSCHGFSGRQTNVRQIMPHANVVLPGSVKGAGGWMSLWQATTGSGRLRKHRRSTAEPWSQAYQSAGVLLYCFEVHLKRCHTSFWGCFMRWDDCKKWRATRSLCAGVASTEHPFCVLTVVAAARTAQQ